MSEDLEIENPAVTFPSHIAKFEIYRTRNILQWFRNSWSAGWAPVVEGHDNQNQCPRVFLPLHWLSQACLKIRERCKILIYSLIGLDWIGSSAHQSLRFGCLKHSLQWPISRVYRSWYRLTCMTCCMTCFLIPRLETDARVSLPCSLGHSFTGSPPVPRFYFSSVTRQ